MRERNDMPMHIYIYIYIAKKKEKKFIARLVEGSETYVHPCLRMNVKSVLKIHFPRQENIALEKVPFLFSVELPGHR
jgi:hypothetical protein